jgi:small-conductance mechanosensitive channel
MTGQGLRIRQEIRRLMIHSGDIPGRIASAFEIASPDGTWSWLIRGIVVALLGIVAGFVPARLIQRWGREHFRYMYNPEPADTAEKATYLLFRAMLTLVNHALMFVVAMVVAIALDNEHLPTRQTTISIVFAYIFWRFLRYTVLFNLLAPDVPRHRLLNLDDLSAKQVYRELYWGFGISVALLGLSEWMRRLELDGDAHKLLLIASTILGALLIGFMLIRHRVAFRNVVLGFGDPASKPLWRRFLAGGWHIFGVAYLVVAAALAVLRILLGLPAAPALLAAPAVAFIGSLTAYAALLVMIERFYRGRRRRFQLRIDAEQRELERKAEMARQAFDEAGADADPSEIMVINRVTAGNDQQVKAAEYRPIFKPLLEQAAGVLVSIVALGFVLNVWDVRVGERGNPITEFLGTLMVIFITWFIYRAVNDYINRKLADEGGHPAGAAVDLEEEPGEHSSSRLGTLLPLLRIVLSGFILAVAGMILLSGIGVDISPLFAGAGVVGLAVGFGAQTMIRDIFSGAFFLFDDAFRKGEYVELGSIRGTVEKISLRSFQLRHHNGPLHTIPFGEITQLTNYSRDWVIMKLPLRVTFDTDVEKVRKLVKKLGQQLLSHPEVGKSFLQPLKSQGVVEMDDSAMVIRVKFMTKPGDQWATRKVVYAAIQELFHREGIRFANREVTVRIAGDQGETTPETVRKAATAAARQVVDNSPLPTNEYLSDV